MAEAEGAAASPPRAGACRLGICAMAKKAHSAPMRRLLHHLRLIAPHIAVVIFPERSILRDRVECWPRCDVLIAFHSHGFPLQKAIAYVELRRPHVLNDLHAQQRLLDRRAVLAMLVQHHIPHPDTFYAGGGAGNGGGCAWPEERGDVLIIPAACGDRPPAHAHGTAVIVRPFLEKPADAEDHNVWVYYAASAGGGARKLFRKSHTRSSVFEGGSHHIRRDGLYLYQKMYASTERLDVKVYTVGARYFYAEARKAPTVDGVVERDSQGMEARRSVALSEREIAIARSVALAARQFICGFDLLKSDDLRLVIDVNGWSFVKGNEEYSQRCARVLAEEIAELQQASCDGATQRSSVLC